MKEFSIQDPGTRGFLNEYVLHQLFTEEDVLPLDMVLFP